MKKNKKSRKISFEPKVKYSLEIPLSPENYKSPITEILDTRREQLINMTSEQWNEWRKEFYRLNCPGVLILD